MHTSPENTATKLACTALLHSLGEQVLQTADVIVHNDAIRGLIAGRFGLLGSFATFDCITCGEQVRVPAHALIIDPQI